MRFVAIIPARGGSKGVPNKNIRQINGKPLISYTIDAAINSKYVDRTIVSTDDDKIALISKQYGAEVPFHRPRSLALDETPTLPVIQHALQMLDNYKDYDGVITLQPTSPLRNSNDIDNSIEIFLSKKPDSVISVTAVKQHPYLTFRIVDGLLKSNYEETQMVRRQDLPPIYFINGAIYLTRPEVILFEKSFYGKKSIPYIMEKKKSYQIDDPIDIKIIETLLGDI